jgi:hypothetical protein
VPRAPVGWHYFFAEGVQGPGFDTFLLLTNAETASSTAQVRFLRRDDPGSVRTYTVPPRSRLTIYCGALPELADQVFGIDVRLSRRGSAERATYFGHAGSGGHVSTGVSAPSSRWYFAEGATGSFFRTYLLLSNPGSAPAEGLPVTITYYPIGGPRITREKRLGAFERLSIDVALEDPALAASAVAMEVQATSPIVAERSQYWPASADGWYEGHNGPGLPFAWPRWGVADGSVGGPQRAHTYLLILNPGGAEARVSIRFDRADGTSLTKEVIVPAASRIDVAVGPGSLVPELVDEEFSAVLSADQPIVVERATYWDSGGRLFGAGGAAAGTPIP